jgi:hypothetical protein
MSIVFRENKSKKYAVLVYDNSEIHYDLNEEDTFYAPYPPVIIMNRSYSHFSEFDPIENNLIEKIKNQDNIIKFTWEKMSTKCIRQECGKYKLNEHIHHTELWEKYLWCKFLTSPNFVETHIIKPDKIYEKIYRQLVFELGDISITGPNWKKSRHKTLTDFKL